MPARVEIQIARSRLSGLASITLLLALICVFAALWTSPGRIWATLLLLLIVGLGAATKMRLAPRPRTVDQIIIAASDRIWFGASSERGQIADQEFPQLIAMRHYLGLLWIKNSQGTVLLWPDQLSPDDARKLRVWQNRLIA